MDKNKKKTLTIKSNLTKKIDTSSISTEGKKSFLVEKKKYLNRTNNLKDQVLHLTFLLIKIIRTTSYKRFYQKR